MLSNQDVVDLIAENSEESRELIYDSFENVIDIYINKYKKLFYLNGIEFQDGKAECLYAFNDALKCFDIEKNSSFSTFLSMCIDRRLSNIIRNASTTKNKALNTAYSLNYVYDELGIPLENLLQEPDKDPFFILENEESDEILQKKIKDSLSALEFVVYNLMLDNYDLEKIANYLEKDKKQIDNAMQRVKVKIKDILENKKQENI